MAFLDNAGLAHFTAWVKSRLSGKQDKLAAGDGVRIAEAEAGPTLSVTTPVRGVVTQAEFDALPEEQRGRGFYIISDGGGVGLDSAPRGGAL